MDIQEGQYIVSLKETLVDRHVAGIEDAFKDRDQLPCEYQSPTNLGSFRCSPGADPRGRPTFPPPAILRHFSQC